MQYRRLGRAGLHVSTIALGSWLTYGGPVAEDKLLFDRPDGVEFSRYVEAVGAIHVAFPQFPRSEKPHQAVREKDVDVRRDDELSPRATDADVLRDHLEER